MIDKLIDRYIAIRDRKGELTKTYKAEVQELEDALTRIEQELAKTMVAAGTERMGTAHGVAFFLKETGATLKDKDAFFDFLQTSGNWQLADIRASKKQIAEYLEETSGLPPGVDWREARVVRVNRV